MYNTILEHEMDLFGLGFERSYGKGQQQLKDLFGTVLLSKEYLAEKTTNMRGMGECVGRGTRRLDSKGQDVNINQ